MKKINNITILLGLIEDEKSVGTFKYKNKTIQIGISGGTAIDRVKRVYNRREEQGLCKKCGKRKPKKGLKNCNKCLEKQREYKKKIKNK